MDEKNTNPRGTWCRPPVEWGGQVRGLVVFGERDIRYVEGRTMLGLERDLIARVDLAHRCGTDVAIFQNGRPQPLEESLVDDLREGLGIDVDLGERSGPLARLFLDGTEDGAPPEAVEYWRGLPEEKRASLRRTLYSSWGRVIGHEFVATIVHVGSSVANIREGIGYLEGSTVNMGFSVGQQVTVQTRVATYRPPAGFSADREDMCGVQLLGRDITNMAMTYDGAFAEYVRLSPEFIASGSVIPIPTGVDPVEAALVEPTACLLDCLEKGTHEVGQTLSGVVHKKGVMPGGVTAVFGSGSMAILAGRFAMARPDVIPVGGAREVVFIVRSEEKAKLVSQISADKRVRSVVAPKGSSPDEVARHVLEQYGPGYKEERGESFLGFDDVIIACPGKDSVIAATKLLGIGGRIYSFAGTRGPATTESGLWHYQNAGIVGSSGCNTRMMEIVLQLIAEKKLKLADLSGRAYRLSELKEDASPFFTDTRLRPCLLPQE